MEPTKKILPEVRHFVRNFNILLQKLTLTNFLKAVLDEKIYGTAEIEIHERYRLKDSFNELPPIFKNTTVVCRAPRTRRRIWFDEKRLEMSGRKVFWRNNNHDHTDYIKCCLDHSLIVIKCYQILCYKTDQPFRHFQNFATVNRRRGDVDKPLGVIAEASKAHRKQCSQFPSHYRLQI